MSTTQPLKVHISGVYGLIGNLMYRHLSSQPERFEVYGSGRRAVSSRRAERNAILQLPDGHFSIADLGDAGAVRKAIEGMDAVLHIGAVPGPEASFEETLNSNIIGTYNVLEACREAGTRRLVYASSIMTGYGYFRYAEPYVSIRKGHFDQVPENIPMVTHLDPPRPTEPYSASKVYGEAICRTYADAHAISTVCLRLGYVNKQDLCEIPFADSTWLSQRDCIDLIDRALAATEEPVFDVCYGVSDNKYRWVDLAHAREVLGFIPQDSHERRYAAAKAKPA